MITLEVGDLVVLTVKDHPKFPSRGTGYVTSISDKEVSVKLDEFCVGQAEDVNDEGIVIRKLSQLDKPLELFYEQISKRVAKGK